jgi:hypothetical protein
VDWIAIAGLLNGENARPLGEVRIVLDHLRVGKRSDDLSHAEAICRRLIISEASNEPQSLVNLFHGADA